MSPFVALVVACATGMGLGLFYFGGLWLTVRGLPSRRYPVPLFLGSFILRTAVALVGFYLVMGDRWERALACLAGFIVVRQLLVSRLRSEPGANAPSRQEST